MGVKSDCDEQLLFMLSFTTPVAITNFQFVATNKGWLRCALLGFLSLTTSFLLLDQAPRKFKIFSNVLNMDFDDAESRVPTLELELSEGNEFVNIGHEKMSNTSTEDIGSQLQVQLAKFKRVSSLSVCETVTIIKGYYINAYYRFLSRTIKQMKK